MSSISHEPVATAEAPAALGPYSQAVKVPGLKLLYTSGSLGLSPKTGKLASDLQGQVIQALDNLDQVLIAGSSSRQNVVKTTCFLKNMSDFKEMNTIYEKFFAPNKPARSTVEVARLPADALFELEAIATITD